MLVWLQKSKYKINYSHFFRGGWHGVLKWCNVQAHKIIISAFYFSIDFRPTLTYQSTSADLRQQHLTSFCAVCGVLFYQKRESTVVSSGVRDVTLMTHICSHLAECLQSFVTKLGIVVHHHELECHAKKWDSIFKVKVTVWAYISKTWQFLLYLLLVINQWVFCNQT